MGDTNVEVQCYNRGCGQKYKPATNDNDSCRHHPGEPFFHDAYKGWTCCNKKCTDFTEFLNIKGCTVSKHSNIKPPEPVKPAVKDELDQEIVEVKPLVPSTLKRPSLNAPMVLLKADIAPSLRQQLQMNVSKTPVVNNTDDSVIAIGTICKNGGCSASYAGPESDHQECVYHPGCPIFHEGMKYWSCCNRKTSDFNAFLSQVGCTKGSHVWKKDDADSQTVQCRWDWHQTGSHVIVSVYAKDYCPDASAVQLNPIRLYVHLLFPSQSNTTFTLDIELKGIVNVEMSQATMFGTKVEVKLKKAELGSWPKLEIAKPKDVPKPVTTSKVEELTPQVDAVDLSGI